LLGQWVQVGFLAEDLMRLRIQREGLESLYEEREEVGVCEQLWRTEDSDLHVISIIPGFGERGEIGWIVRI